MSESIADAVPPGPCWHDSGVTWPGMAPGATVHCELLAGHAGAHTASRLSMGGEAVWPNDAEHHALAQRLYVALVEQRVIDSQKHGEAPYAPITPEDVHSALASVIPAGAPRRDDDPTHPDPWDEGVEDVQVAGEVL